jgi:hypothetical protein
VDAEVGVRGPRGGHLEGVAGHAPFLANERDGATRERSVAVDDVEEDLPVDAASNALPFQLESELVGPAEDLRHNRLRESSRTVELLDEPGRVVDAELTSMAPAGSISQAKG